MTTSALDFGEPFKHNASLDWIPEALKLYLDFLEETEPSIEHKLGVFSAIMSQIIGGISFIHYGMKPVKMNLYVGLVAPSGGRKTEAIKLGMLIYDELMKRNPALKPPLPDISSNVSIMQSCDVRNEERLVSVLKNSEEQIFTPVFIVSSEFSSFIRTRDRDMITFLTTIYDGSITGDEFTYKTQLGGYFRIKNPYAVLLMASTPEWLSQSLPKQSAQGGFLNRFLFFYSEKFQHKAFPQTQLNQGVFSKLIEHMLWISTLHAEVKWNEEAQRIFREWYESTGGILEDNPLIKTWSTRLAIFLIKLAGISALADKRIVIEPKDLRFSWNFMNYVYHGVKKTLRFSGGNERSWLETEIVKKVLESENGFIKVSKLCIEFSGEASAKEIREIILSLAETGILKYSRTGDMVQKTEETEKFIES